MFFITWKKKIVCFSFPVKLCYFSSIAVREGASRLEHQTSSHLLSIFLPITYTPSICAIIFVFLGQMLPLGCEQGAFGCQLRFSFACWVWCLGCEKLEFFFFFFAWLCVNGVLYMCNLVFNFNFLLWISLSNSVSAILFFFLKF